MIFLDVEMPWMNGFEMLELLDHIDFSIIFTTAYDKFAAKAFRISAVDYLLKPVDAEDLKTAVKKRQKKKLTPHQGWLISRTCCTISVSPNNSKNCFAQPRRL